MEHRVRELREKYTQLWWDTPCDTPLLGALVPCRRQKDNAREAEHLIDSLAREIERYPDREQDQRAWHNGIKDRVRQFGAERLGWPGGYQNLLFAEEFYETTLDFIRQARAFDETVRIDDLTQALRNVWIANSLQMLLDRPVRLSPCVFGYSMLYPWTDNYLDDPRLPRAEKVAFNARFARRLEGRRPEPGSERERQVFDLVARIEADHDRSECPEVYGSLLAIHRAQVGSLTQQGSAACPYEVDLLGISVEKGGTSVLADGYLVAGRLSPEEADFAFGYGVFLQLLDDLQDARTDRAARQMTVFSQSAGVSPLDRLAGRLHRLVSRVIGDSPRFSAPAFEERTDLIRRNCTFLLVGAVAENEDLFTRRFARELEERWPFDFASVRRLRRRATRRYHETVASLRRRRGMPRGRATETVFELARTPGEIRLEQRPAAGNGEAS